MRAMSSGLSHLRRDSLHRALLASAVVMALVVRAMVPAGFMPVSVPGLPFKLVVCTAFGLSAVDGPAHDEPSDQGDRQHASTGLCHFSLAGKMAPGADAALALIAVAPRHAAGLRVADRSPPPAMWPMAGTPRAPPRRV